MLISYHVYQILYVANRMLGAGSCCMIKTFILSSHPACRCQRPPCRAVSRAGVARPRCPPTPWPCTSSRSPWLMGSPRRRSNSSSSSSQASRANSNCTTCRQRETGRLFIAAAHVFAPAVPHPVTRMVCTPPSWQKTTFCCFSVFFILLVSKICLALMSPSVWVFCRMFVCSAKAVNCKCLYCKNWKRG